MRLPGSLPRNTLTPRVVFTPGCALRSWSCLARKRDLAGEHPPLKRLQEREAEVYACDSTIESSLGSEVARCRRRTKAFSSTCWPQPGNARFRVVFH